MFDVISFICNPLPLKKNTNTSEIQNSAYIEKKKWSAVILDINLADSNDALC